MAPALDRETARAVEELRLLPHPEGGFYRETYRSPMRVPTPRGERAAMTAIHFLLPSGSFSAFHRVLSDEVWIHSGGDPLRLERLSAGGAHRPLCLGPGDHAVVPAGEWQAARPLGPGFALVTCVVAPGFEFADLELARRPELERAFPGLSAEVLALARP